MQVRLTQPFFCNSSFVSTFHSSPPAFPLFLSCLLISESQPPRLQPCDLCVYDVFPFCFFARPSPPTAEYVTLHRGFHYTVFDLKPLGSTCCRQINERMHCPSLAADLSKHATGLLCTQWDCSRSVQLLGDCADHENCKKLKIALLDACSTEHTLP